MSSMSSTATATAARLRTGARRSGKFGKINRQVKFTPHWPGTVNFANLNSEIRKPRQRERRPVTESLHRQFWQTFAAVNQSAADVRLPGLAGPDSDGSTPRGHRVSALTAVRSVRRVGHQAGHRH